MGAKHVPVNRVNAVVHEDPKNYRQAMRDPRANKWKQVIKEELDALEQNGTWRVAKKPPGTKCLLTKWVFKLKTHADGTIERYKARLVARGDEQEYGVDYTFTFSAVLEMVSGKVVLVVSRIWNIPARHGDVPNAYVKANKETELIFILLIPQGMEFTEEQLRALGVTSKYELVLILEKGLYGLKQSAVLYGQLFYIKSERDGMKLVGIYVDDILVTATSENKVDRFFDDKQIVELKNLGVVSKFLGIAFHYDEEDGWAIDQEQVIQDMLLKFQLHKAVAARTPIGGGQDGEEIAFGGNLIVDSRCTRPDILFAVHRVTRNALAPTEADWRLAKRIAKYLKGTKELKLLMNTDENAMGDDGVLVEALSDADHASDKKDRKSVTGGVLMVAGVVVAWLCKKQACVALSTMESEFVAAS
ncbi:hypothetical protein PC113_g20237 [Phytophthora cactorum]|uniref:Reverse transcriptase Ty1/copia-type domain-containing protein n=1 Tax=Phytophthora cactorum TaxID=29920 RepID=A0A8T0YAZ9_9STRA|nr:hypothetical protein PC113_g20237 [Phytophthora cactorum]